MLVVLLVYQQIENNVLTPKIQGKAVNLSGFFIIIAVTLFGSLLGVLGALTAVPLAATIQIFVQELTRHAARRSRPRTQHSTQLPNPGDRKLSCDLTPLLVPSRARGPLERIVGDLFPALLGGEEVRSALVLLHLGDGVRRVVLGVGALEARGIR